MRRSVVLLASLLLMCVLMAGAVSAANEIEFNQSSFSDGKYTISNAGTYVLNATACGTVEINAKDQDQDVTITAKKDAALHGRINITSAKTVTVHQMTFHLNKSMTPTGSAYLRAVEYPLYLSIKFNLTGNTLFVDPDVVAAVQQNEDTKVKAQLFASNGGVSDGTIFSGNTVYNATGHAITFHGIAGNGKATVEKNSVSLYPDEDITSTGGRALVKVWLYQNNKNVNLTIRDNTLTNNRPEYQVSMFRVDGSSNDPEKGGFTELTVEMKNNQVNGVLASPYLYAGSVSSEKLKGFLVKNTEDSIQLIPGLNQTGVAWTDNSDGWTLAISESGSYKLTDSFNLKSMTVSKENVVIDGNKDAGVKVTLASDATANPIKITGNTVTLKNLDVTAAISGTAGANSNGVIQFTGTGGKLQNSKIDFSGITLSSGSFAAVRINGENGEVSDSEIINGGSTASSSQCIVVGGNNVKIQNNKLTPNTAAEYKSDNTKVSSGSIGVRIAANVESITITGNTITCTQTDTSMNNGIAIDGVNKAVTITANNNKFTLSTAAAKKEENKKGQVGGFGNAFYVNPAAAIASNAITLNADGNKVTGGTYFLYADSDNGGTTSYTLSGTIQNNDFGTISGKKYEKTPIGTLTVTTSSLTWKDNVEPAIPDVPKVTPTTNVDGSTTITPPAGSSGATSFDATTSTAKIGTDTSTVHLEISGSGVTRDATSGVITAPADAVIKAVYKEAPAATASTTTAKFALSIVLKDVAVDKLPTISPAFNEDKASSIPSGYTAAVMITALNPTDINSHITLGGIQLTFSVPKTWVNSIGKSNLAAFHIDATGANPAEITGIDDTSDPVKVTVKGDTFSTYALAAYTATPSSGDGNMENAFRVLFDTQGGSSVTPATGLSYGDKITAPANPVRDGYTFGGWYKDAACTQAWSFSDGIPGDMSLYAKWTGGSAAQQTTTATASATAQPTEKQTTAPVQTQSSQGTSATTAAPAATTAAGVSPTLTQAPAPVFGALLGLLAAGVLLRRRD